MIIKRGDVEIIGVIKDDDHLLSDEQTREALADAKKKKASKEDDIQNQNLSEN